MPRLAEPDVIKLMDTLSNWGRWGKDDELGTINHITPAVRRRAAALVRDGVSVTCARPIVTSEIEAPPTPPTLGGGPGNPGRPSRRRFVHAL